jgi:uncharacterized hydrophobic protein (TIGR00271 family)
MSPIAALGFGFASIDGQRIRDAARVVLVGAAIGILTGVLITWLSPIRNATPEILARTQPTLLDLAVALFSGVAGGYATVIRKGGTAIGVAIATALMPPLATLGYGLGVLQIGFALGALLLFLTNLAAIAFAFAVVARLSGAARPMYRVEWTPRYVAILIAAFVALAVPLSMTLVRITQEASMRNAARDAIRTVTGTDATRIAQLDVAWPLFGDPSVEALVITPKYTANAEQVASELLSERMGDDVSIKLQQVMAADLQSQTRAMVDAAMERTAAGIAADVPPFDAIRNAIGLPTRSLWTNRAQRMVYVEPVPAPEWSLADYRVIEKRATRADDKWTVRIVPPPSASLTVILPQPEPEATEGEPKPAPARRDALPDNAVPIDLTVWALQRWGMGRVALSSAQGAATEPLRKALSDAGIVYVASDGDPPARSDIAVLEIYAPSPAKVAAAEAKAKAEAEAKAKEEAAAKAKAEAANAAREKAAARTAAE